MATSYWALKIQCGLITIVFEKQSLFLLALWGFFVCLFDWLFVGFLCKRKWWGNSFSVHGLPKTCQCLPLYTDAHFSMWFECHINNFLACISFGSPSDNINLLCTEFVSSAVIYITRKMWTHFPVDNNCLLSKCIKINVHIQLYNKIKYIYLCLLNCNVVYIYAYLSIYIHLSSAI